MHFSSVFTREDTSSIHVPETKFKGSEGERLGQLVVTPEVVDSKINNMIENKSPGVDGISPKILKETVGQISAPLAHVFNMSLQEGIVPFEWKEANIIPLFKKGSRNKSVNYRPVSLTSVICELLETIIRDHMMDFLIKHKLINPSQHGFLFDLCEGGSRIADLESGRVRDVHASTVNPDTQTQLPRPLLLSCRVCLPCVGKVYTRTQAQPGPTRLLPNHLGLPQTNGLGQPVSLLLHQEDCCQPHGTHTTNDRLQTPTVPSPTSC